MLAHVVAGRCEAPGEPPFFRLPLLALRDTPEEDELSTKVSPPNHAPSCAMTLSAKSRPSFEYCQSSPNCRSVHRNVSGI